MEPLLRALMARARKLLLRGEYESTKPQKKEAIRLPLRGNRQRPILPGRVQPSTFGTGELNYCVRYGNRWDLSVITTGRGVFDPFRLFALLSDLSECAKGIQPFRVAP